MWNIHTVEETAFTLLGDDLTAMNQVTTTNYPLLHRQLKQIYIEEEAKMWAQTMRKLRIRET